MAYETFITTGKQTVKVTGPVRTQKELIRAGKLPPSQIPGTTAFRKSQEAKRKQEEQDKAMGILFRETKGQKGYISVDGKRVPSYSKWQELQARKGRPAEFLEDFELYLRETGQYKEVTKTTQEKIKEEEKKAITRQKIQELKTPTPFTVTAKTTKKEMQELAQAQLLAKAGLVPTKVSEKGIPTKFVKRTEAEEMGLVSPAPFRSVLYDANNPDFLARETARLTQDFRQTRQLQNELNEISATKKIELAAIDANKRQFEKDLKAYETAAANAPRSIIRGAQGGFTVQLQSGEIVETGNLNPFLKRQEDVAKQYDRLKAMERTLNIQVDNYYSDPDTMRLYQLQNELEGYNIQAERVNKAVRGLNKEKKELYGQLSAKYTGAARPKIGEYVPTKEAEAVRAREQKVFDEFLQDYTRAYQPSIFAFSPAAQAMKQAPLYFRGAELAERGIFGQPLPTAPKGAAVLTAEQKRKAGIGQEPLPSAIGRRAFRIGTVAVPVGVVTGGVGALPSAALFTAGGAVAGEVTEREAKKAGLTKPVQLGPFEMTQAQVAGFAAEVAGGGLFAKAGAGAARAAKAPITRRITRPYQPTIEIKRREPFMLLGPEKGRFAATAGDIELRAALRRPTVKYPEGIRGGVQKNIDSIRFAIAKREFGGVQKISAEDIRGKVELYEVRELSPKFTPRQGQFLAERFGVTPFKAPEITPEGAANLVRGIAEGKPRIAVVPKGMPPGELNFLRTRGYTLVSADEYGQIRNLLSTRKISVEGELRRAGITKRREPVKEELVIGARKAPKVEVTETPKEIRAKVDFPGRVAGPDYYGTFRQRMEIVRDNITGQLEKGVGRIDSKIKVKSPLFERPIQVKAESPFDLIKQRQRAYAKAIAPKGKPTAKPIAEDLYEAQRERLRELIPEKPKPTPKAKPKKKAPEPTPGFDRTGMAQIQRARQRQFLEEDIFLAQQGAIAEQQAAVRGFLKPAAPKTRTGILSGIFASVKQQFTGKVPTTKRAELPAARGKLPTIALPRMELGIAQRQRGLELAGFGFGDMGAVRARQAQRTKQATAPAVPTPTKTPEKPPAGVPLPRGGVVKPFMPFGPLPGFGLEEEAGNLKKGQLKYFNEIGNALAFFSGRRARKPTKKRGKKK